MSCDEIMDLLPLYVDNALTPDEISKVDKHLVTCDACSAMLELLKGDQAALRSQPDVQVPSSFRRDLMARIEAEETKVGRVTRNAWRYLVPRFSSLAAALLLIVLATNLYFVPRYIEQQRIAQFDTSRFGIMSAGPEAQPDAGGEFAGKGIENVQLAGDPRGHDPLAVGAWAWTTGLSVVIFSGAVGFWIYRYRRIQ